MTRQPDASLSGCRNWAGDCSAYTNTGIVCDACRLVHPAVVGIEGREALEPFAKLFTTLEGFRQERGDNWPSDDVEFIVHSRTGKDRVDFTFGDLRRAHTALARHPHQPVEDERRAVLSKALADVRQELWVDYCLVMGRTDTDPRPFDSKPHIRIIDTALAHSLEPATNNEVKPYYSDDPDCIPGN